ncbi:MAG TPA: hypothetical protein VMX16_17765 [Terriglobia bacterium]|nr:hypothetical protein [Terriglobia bacterium]
MEILLVVKSVATVRNTLTAAACRGTACRTRGGFNDGRGKPRPYNADEENSRRPERRRSARPTVSNALGAVRAAHYRFSLVGSLETVAKGETNETKYFGGRSGRLARAFPPMWTAVAAGCSPALYALGKATCLLQSCGVEAWNYRETMGQAGGGACGSEKSHPEHAYRNVTIE